VNAEEGLRHLVGGTVIDGLGSDAVDRGVVSFHGGRLTYAGPESGARISRGDDRVDVAGHTILPGLIDCHVHHIYAMYRNIAEVDRSSLEASTIKAVLNTRTFLEAGYTTVRDCGTRGNIAAELRDAIVDGLIPGPRIHASGRVVTTTGGLADSNPAWILNMASMACIVDGPDEVRRAVRQQVKEGVDNIKIEGSGAEASFHAYTWMSTMSYEEMAAATEEAHKYGKTVAAHCQSYEGAKNALRAGADTIEHGTRLDDEAIELFRRSPTVLVPTLCTLYSVLELAEKVGAIPKQLAEMRAHEQTWLDSLAMAKAAGITIATGSDVGNRYPQGSNAKELQLLTEHGFTPMEAIVAATSNGAKALRRSDGVGSLEAGKYADILVVAGDPLADITVLQDRERLVMIFKGGQLVAGTAANGLGPGGN
jgi:imidazolonepropionase-like amidohydrolase